MPPEEKGKDESDTTAGSKNTDDKKPDESGKTEDKTVPYARFKEVNDRLKALTDQYEADKAEAEKKRQESLPEEEKRKEAIGKIPKLEAETKALKAENKALTDALSGYLEAELKGLSDKERKAIQGMADNPLGQLAAIAQAKAAGWIGGKREPPATTHNGKSGGSSNDRPKTLAEARAAMNRDLREKKL